MAGAFVNNITFGRLIKNSARAPIATQEIVIGEKEDIRPRTRCGYLIPEAYSCYEKALGESGAVASGKLLHYAADIICSGGLDLWIRGAYSYCVQHIGLANPRIFVYIRQRISELDKKAEVLPQESFYNHPDVQSAVSECVLVMQLCPRRAKVPWPKVGENTKREGWLRGIANSPETRAVRVVWSSDGDMTSLFLAGNELCRSIQEGKTEQSLFWVKWMLEEDSRLKKETKGGGLTTKLRGGVGKQKPDASFFIVDLLKEIYKEFSAKSLIRMNEEFAELYRLFVGGEPRMAPKEKRDCLGWMVLICCEVPRWKVPAAPTLVEDPMRLSRAVSQSSSFFREVLSHPPLPVNVQIKASMARITKQKTKKQKTEGTLDDHFNAYEEALQAYLQRN
jgi:hypothetical protein